MLNLVKQGLSGHRIGHAQVSPVRRTGEIIVREARNAFTQAQHTGKVRQGVDTGIAAERGVHVKTPIIGIDISVIIRDDRGIRCPLVRHKGAGKQRNHKLFIRLAEEIVHQGDLHLYAFRPRRQFHPV